MNGIKIFLAAFFLAIVGWPAVVKAESTPLFYEGIRPLGMGGAFTAVANGENGMFYNPAGLLNHGEKSTFEITLPTMEVGTNLIDIVQDGIDLSKQSNNEAEELTHTTNFVNKWLGERFYLKTSLFPNLIFQRSAIGLLAQTTVQGAIHNPLSSSVIDVAATGDVALLLSYARPITVRAYPLNAGVTFKGVRRYTYNREYTIRELIVEKIDASKDLKEGTGVAMDVGFLYPMEGLLKSRYFKSIAFKPSVGLSLQNIIGGDLGEAGKLPFQANLGVSLKQGGLILAADMVDLTRNIGKDNDFGKRLHMGAEYQFPYIFTFRTGLYQGYPSFGTTINLWIIHLSYAYYVEEIGAFAGQQPDPHHVVRLSLF